MFENSIARYLEKHGHPNIQLKAVLFDMDGVLFNSMPYHA
ncbi:MAG TPA: beta-phosphoglucomutase, partial [Bacteroides uniformis]|nr:beta-phosphoglucomutase [Bacteroides uniformis]